MASETTQFLFGFVVALAIWLPPHLSLRRRHQLLLKSVKALPPRDPAFFTTFDLSLKLTRQSDGESFTIADSNLTAGWSGSAIDG